LLRSFLNSAIDLQSHIFVRSLFLNIVYVNIVDSVVKVSNIESERVVVHQLHVVYLFVDVLVS